MSNRGVPKTRKPFGPVLKSMNEIETYTGRDETVIRRLIEEEGFPAARIGGRWQAVTADVNDWYRRQASKKNGVPNMPRNRS